MITIKDVARSAGVSHTTVSRALRGDTRITPDTTERILQLADEMGYVPNSIAQSLNSQRTFTIGMLVTTVADPVVMDIVEGAEPIAQQHGYCLFLSTSRNDPQREISMVETFQQRRVDGIIVAASRIGDGYRSALERIQVPLVLMTSQEVHETNLTVDTDSFAGARLAVEHLLRLGHRQIGYIGAADRPRTNERRMSGYRTTIEETGIEIDPNWVAVPAAEDDIQRGWLGLEQCLAAGTTAIFCHNDQIAIGILNACYHKEISIPDELSIVGFDDVRAASYVNPALTTVRQPLQEIGKEAMQMVLGLINQELVEAKLLDCELVMRASTAAYKSGVR